MVAADDGLVGRVDVLDQVRNAMDGTAREQVRTIFIAGTAGIGKTSVAEAAVHTARSQEIEVGWGTCWDGGAMPGFWPWIQIFDDLTASFGLDAAHKFAGRHSKLLSVLIRDLGESAPEYDERDRAMLLHAAMRWLESAAAASPVVIVLDDLQWADESSLDLLRLVTQSRAPVPLTVIGLFRDDEMSATRGQLFDLASHNQHIQLKGLSIEEVSELAAKITGREATAQTLQDLHERTQGHPLFVREIAGLPGGAPPPLLVRDAASRRVRDLPTASIELLQLAAVQGKRSDVGILADVARLPADEVRKRLETAVVAGIVDEDEWGRFIFSHDLYREAVYAELTPTRRAEIHLRFGEALEASFAAGASPDPGDLARHFTNAVPVSGPDKALDWAWAAAQADQKRAAFAEAAARLQRVYEAAGATGRRIDDEYVVKILSSAAENLARSGDLETARSLLNEAHEVALVTDPQLVAEVVLATAQLGSRFAIRRDQLIQQLRSALDLLSPDQTSLRARLMAALARELQHSVSADRDEAAALSIEALALGRKSVDDKTLAMCLLARHDALWAPGTGQSRVGLAVELAEIGERTEGTGYSADGRLLEATALIEVGEPTFRQALQRWFDLLHEDSEPRDRYLALTRQAFLALLEDRLEDAEQLLNEAAVLGEEIGEPDTGNVLMSHRVALAWARGEPEEFKTLALDAVKWWTGAPVHAHAIAAGAWARAGNMSEAQREINLVEASGGWRNENSYLQAVFLPYLASAAVACDDKSLARELLAEFEPMSNSCGVNGAAVAFSGPFAYSLGILSGILGREKKSREYLATAESMAQSLGALGWVRDCQRGISELDDAPPTGQKEVFLCRSDRRWTLDYDDQTVVLAHVKGLGDIAELVSRPNVEVTALTLMGSPQTSLTQEEAVDRATLANYRTRLADLEQDIQESQLNNDTGRTEKFEAEREHILEELQRVAGLGGRPRSSANQSVERARKAVSARIRDAISRISEVAPEVGEHLDRNIVTGIQCTYQPEVGTGWSWKVERSGS